MSDLSRDKLDALSYTPSSQPASQPAAAATGEKPSGLSNWLTPIPGRLLTTTEQPGTAATSGLRLPMQIALSWPAPSGSYRPFTDRANRIRVSLISDRKTRTSLCDRWNSLGSLVGRLSVNLQSIRGICVYGALVGLIVLSRLN